ncbi:hypothetical protein Plav_1585 [Parvibaculum lavamentivorans DS-1]|uniref:DUF2125 domain-containing protein n=1 Tax=Parvibaculum lavamentivorans (strain DS-1 / DSM 13023 / NCIMB 13966) TaxID=402881 RepID=A7HTH1_PARL1|nr:DUF2125 domain-containing protein [Parvibaculum lavamentivorans]ABS63204.1 hypothetical protein Plav_1585 [Parvibaculum lavamentivorans DS-1]
MTDPVTDIRPAPPKRRWGLFLPAAALLLLVAVYTVYWFTIAGELREGVEAFAARRDNGLVVSWDDLAITGYPYRIEADFTAPGASAPDAPEEWAWHGEGAAFALLPYNLRHVIVNLEGEQTFSYRDVTASAPARNEARATAAKAWGSYVDVADAPFGRIAIDIEELDARHRRGATGLNDRLTAERLQFHTRAAIDEANGLINGSYDVAIQADGVVLESEEKILALGPNIKQIVAQARLRDLPQTPHVSAIELLREWQRTGGVLSISELIVKWGPLDLAAHGEFKLDARRRLEGQFDAKITGFETLLDAMVRDGLVKEREANVALAGLVLVSQFQGKKTNEVRIPVMMREGLLYLGPLAVARLEPLY